MDLTTLQIPTYFLPISFFQEILNGKDVVWADTFPYAGQSFQNRMKIRTPDGFQWLTIPLKAGKSGKALHHVEISYAENWQRQHWKSIENNYKATPFFEYFEAFIFPIFQQRFSHLAELNLASIEVLLKLMDISVKSQKLSNVPENVGGMRDLAAHFPEKTWLSTPETAPIFEKCGLNHHVNALKSPIYRQVFTGFIPNLNILDVLLMYGEETLTVLR